MKNIIRKIRGNLYNYVPLIKVLVSQRNLVHNFDLFQSKLGEQTKVVPVLKSNAYGHGLIKVAKIMESKNPEFVVVDSFYEAMILRNEGIKSKILIIGFSLIENILNNGLEDVSFMITDLSWLKELSNKLDRPKKFHLKIDTGMNRQGIELEDIDEAVGLINKNMNIELEGVCSHLADGDNIDKVFTNKQIKKWNNIVRFFRGEFKDLKYWHLSASSGLFFSKKINANIMRLGLSLYGIDADPKLDLDLRPVMEVRTVVSSIRDVKKGEKIGYNCTFEVNKNMKVATISFGYFEGMDRRLSNKGWVQVNGVDCPIVGRVSMNITSVDVSRIYNLKIGDEAIVISMNKKDNNSIENIAKLCGTIPYVIMVGVERKLRRIIADD